jgi:carbon storage regulator
MLVLTRRECESIKIGDEVTVTVLDVRGNNVRIGVAAPRNIPVHRQEIHDRILRDRTSDSNVREPAEL